MSNITKEKNKRMGIIIGHALGDSLGAPVEFYPYSHYTGVLDSPIVRYTRAYGKQVSAIGQVSDDTEMALVLLDTINTGYTKENAVINYMLWANNNYDGCKGNSPFMGKNTRNLFISPKPTMKLYMNRFNKYYPDELIKENSQSNGAMMRSYPLAFIDDDNLIYTDVKITNPSDITANAVFVYIKAIKMAMADFSKKEILEESKKLIKHELISIAFEQAHKNEFRDVTKNRGHVIHSFYCAFWGLFNFDNYKSAIDSIIALSDKPGVQAKICKEGKWKKNDIRVGDTDTNAAIAGALLGAFYGYEEISSNSITYNNINILLNCDSKTGDIVRPDIYNIKNYL